MVNLLKLTTLMRKAAWSFQVKFLFDILRLKLYRLFFPDAIYYTATEYKPHTLIDVATLTG